MTPLTGPGLRRCRCLLLVSGGQVGGWWRAARSVAGGGRLVATSALLLWDVLESAYAHLGFDVLNDEAFKAMVLARIIEPTSKADTIRVLGEVGAPCPSLRTLFRGSSQIRVGDGFAVLTGQVT